MSTLLRPGQVVSQCYRIENVIGEGGMGVVYRAFDMHLNRDVALKTLQQGVFDPESLKRLVREAVTLGRVTHPNIVSVFTAGKLEDQTPFIAMELVQGISLRALIDRDGRLAWQRALAMLPQICAALACIHALGIAHRDLKPSNIMVIAEGTTGENLKLLDFGLCSPGRDIQRVTHTGQMMGSVQYMSPEQIRDGKTVDARADIYSLGCMLYEMLTGSPPHNGDNPVSIMFKQVNVEPPVPSTITSDIPASLDHMVMKMLEKDLTLRYQTIEEIIQDLHDFDALAQPAEKRSFKKKNPHWIAIAGTGAALVCLSWLICRDPSPLLQLLNQPQDKIGCQNHLALADKMASLGRPHDAMTLIKAVAATPKLPDTDLLKLSAQASLADLYLKEGQTIDSIQTLNAVVDKVSRLDLNKLSQAQRLQVAQLVVKCINTHMSVPNLSQAQSAEALQKYCLITVSVQGKAFADLYSITEKLIDWKGTLLSPEDFSALVEKLSSTGSHQHAAERLLRTALGRSQQAMQKGYRYPYMKVLSNELLSATYLRDQRVLKTIESQLDKYGEIIQSRDIPNKSPGAAQSELALLRFRCYLIKGDWRKVSSELAGLRTSHQDNFDNVLVATWQTTSILADLKNDIGWQNLLNELKDYGVQSIKKHGAKNLEHILSLSCELPDIASKQEILLAALANSSNLPSDQRAVIECELARAAQAQNDLQTAEDHLQKAVALSSGSRTMEPSLMLHLGNTLIALHKESQAKKILEQVVEQCRKDDSDLRTVRLKAKFMLACLPNPANPEATKQALQMCLAETGENESDTAVNCLQTLAALEFRKNNFHEGTALLRRALPLAGGVQIQDCKRELALALIANGQSEGRSMLLSLLSEQNKSALNPPSRLLIAEFLRCDGQYNQAIKLNENSIKTVSVPAWQKHFLFSLANVYFNQGKLEAARLYFQKALESLGPLSDVQILNQRLEWTVKVARLYLTTSQIREAAREYAAIEKMVSNCKLQPQSRLDAYRNLAAFFTIRNEQANVAHCLMECEKIRAENRIEDAPEEEIIAGVVAPFLVQLGSCFF